MVKRNVLGIVGWLLLAILLGILSEVLMIDREEYQHQLYKIPFENDDVRRYSISIAIGVFNKIYNYSAFDYVMSLLLMLYVEMCSYSTLLQAWHNVTTART